MHPGHHSPAGKFTRVPGRCLRWSPTPPGPRWSPAFTNLWYNIQLHRWNFTSVQTFHTHTHWSGRRHTHTHAHTPYDFHLSAQIYLLHAINSKDHKIIMAVSSYKLENNDQLKMWKNVENSILKIRLEKMWKNAIRKCEEMWKMWKMLKNRNLHVSILSQFKF